MNQTSAVYVYENTGLDFLFIALATCPAPNTCLFAYVNVGDIDQNLERFCLFNKLENLETRGHLSSCHEAGSA